MSETLSTVLSVEKRRGVAVITLDNAPTMRIPSPLFRERPLCAGGAVDAAQHMDWLRGRAHGFALDVAVAFLAARPRTVREVEKRLEQAGYEETVREQVIQRLSREGYLNDAEFADQWVQSRSERALGSRRLAQELQKKGVDRDVVHAALAQVEEEDQLRIAAELAEKLLARTRGKDARDVQRKVLAALARRGYGWDVARAAIARVGVDDELEWNDDL